MRAFTRHGGDTYFLTIATPKTKYINRRAFPSNKNKTKVCSKFRYSCTLSEESMKTASQSATYCFVLFCLLHSACAHSAAALSSVAGAQLSVAPGDSARVVDAVLRGASEVRASAVRQMAGRRRAGAMSSH